MGENTKIAWCDHTFNPWIGCTKVSSGCDNCYAEREFDNRHHRAVWGVGHPRVRTSAANWNLPLRWNRKARAAIAVGLPRPRVFCASLGDVFDNEVPDVWREELFELIRITPNLDWLLLTKRPQNIVKMVKLHGAIAGNGSRYLPDNVWLGATCENQARANVNVPHLLVTRKELGAKCLFLSVEPMLGSIDLTKLRCEIDLGEGMPWLDAIRGLVFDGNGDSNSCPHIDWVICGGESGPHARPMHPDWVRGLHNQCAEAGVPFFFKQWGEWLGYGASGYPDPESCNDGLPRAPSAEFEFPDGEIVFHVGRATSGDRIDGVQHHAWPEVK